MSDASSPAPMSLVPPPAAVWSSAGDAAYGRLRPGSYGGFLSAAERAKVERVRQARLLFRGLHREYFVAEQRTQFDFPEQEVNGVMRVPYGTINVLRLVALKTGDLLFGEEPVIRVDDEVQQAKLSALAERTGLQERLSDACVECAAEGECYVEACVKRGQVWIRRLPADEMFPIAGEVGPDGQHDAYVRRQVANAGSPMQPAYLLMETSYLPGEVVRRLYALDATGRERLGERPLAEWPAYRESGVVPPPTERTGSLLPTVVWIPNALVGDEAVSSFDGLINLQDRVNAKTTQIDRILEQHADPLLSVPETAARDDGQSRARDKVYYRRPGEEGPQYVVRDLQLDAAIKDRAIALNWLCILAEMSPALLGLKEGAAPDAWKKLRLEASNTLLMAERKSARWKPRLRRLLSVCQDMENAIPGERYDRRPMSVELQDGIPDDPLEIAEEVSVKRGAGVMSIRRALEVEMLGPAAIDQEESRLAREAEEKQPSIFFGGRPGAGAGEAANGEGGDA